MAFQVGEQVGDYEVIGVLGAGGMGKVYEVKNRLSDRIEAMKVLLPNLTENQDVADRFLREIKVLASLEHPNIAALRTAQKVDNQVLMIMEYIDGKPLGDLLSQGTVRRDFGLSFMAQILSALEYAHAKGIIHRDIKPSNVMVTASGLVKLMDFGIARLQADRKLTATGSTLGSLHYMSPEQIRGSEGVDARSDLYSAGVCLYEIVTGKRPFDAPSEYSLMSAHLEEPPRPPVELDATIPEPLNELILVSLAKDPQCRFQSATAFLRALNSVRRQLGFDVPDSQFSAATAGAIVPPSQAVRPEAKAETPAGVEAPVAPAARPRSRRGLYVALGSLITVSVVVAALLLAPKYFRTGAKSTQAPSLTPAAETSVPKGTVPPSAPPAGAASVEPSPSQNASAPSEPVPAVKPQSRRPVSGRAGTSAPADHAASEPVPAPAAAAPAEQVAPEPSTPQANPREQQDAAASRAALSELREQYNQLAIRASTVKTGLQSLQSQMGGLGLRADMREAATRMDYLMGEAMASLRARDADGVRRNLNSADRVIERLEKFLGR